MTASVLRWEGVPSPDGKWIAHQDKDNRSLAAETATKAQKQISHSCKPTSNSSAQYEGVRWSPDSRWFTFAQESANTLSSDLPLQRGDRRLYADHHRPV